MPPRPTLSVPQPCHESWAAMTPTAHGRHCAACAKVVVDFTQKTDAEILTLLRSVSQPCGRFRPDQLGRPLLAPALPAPRWRVWLAAAAAVLGLRELAAEASVGQQKVAVFPDFVTRNLQPGQPQPLAVAPAPDTASSYVVRGRVTDASTGEGLPAVTVLLWNTTIGVATAADGTFALEVPASYQRSATAVIGFSFIGYETQRINLQELHQSGMPVEMKMNSHALGGLVIVANGYPQKPWPWHPRAFWNRVRYAFQR